MVEFRRVRPLEDPSLRGTGVGLAPLFERLARARGFTENEIAVARQLGRAAKSDCDALSEGAMCGLLGTARRYLQAAREDILSESGKRSPSGARLKAVVG